MQQEKSPLGLAGPQRASDETNETASPAEYQQILGASTPTPPALTPEHLADLRHSGLSDDTIAAARFRSMSAAELRLLMGRDDVGSGMAIPYPACTFADGTAYVRVRLDSPLVIHGHQIRYLTRKGERNHLYVPTILPPAALTDPTVPLIIVEGEKKACKLCQDGIPCIAFAGVWAWKTRATNGR